MEVTHLGHACVLVDTGSARILVDPGSYSRDFGDLAVDAILITHRHFDHFDVAAVARMMATRPATHLWVEASTPIETDAVPAERVRRVAPGDELSIAGVPVKVVGGTHARIHADVDLIPNVGYFFPSDGLLHPGDEFIDGLPVRVLLAPISGPWQALGDAVDYVRGVGPEIAIPIHEAVLSHPPLYIDYLTRLAPAGTAVVPLTHGEVFTLPPRAATAREDAGE